MQREDSKSYLFLWGWGADSILGWQQLYLFSIVIEGHSSSFHKGIGS